MVGGPFALPAGAAGIYRKMFSVIWINCKPMIHSGIAIFGDEIWAGRSKQTLIGSVVDNLKVLWFYKEDISRFTRYDKPFFFFVSRGRWVIGGGLLCVFRTSREKHTTIHHIILPA